MKTGINDLLNTFLDSQVLDLPRNLLCGIDSALEEAEAMNNEKVFEAIQALETYSTELLKLNSKVMNDSIIELLNFSRTRGMR